MILFPLLPHHVALEIAQIARSSSVESLVKGAATEHPACEYTPTGGTRAAKRALTTLRNDLLQMAAGTGYPEAPSQQQAAVFDAQAAIVLAQQMPIAPAEAAKGAVWEFMSCVLLPDIVRWRFGGGGYATSIERFVSGRRNTYQRLWWRSYHLSSRVNTGRQLSDLLQLLGEDELVQLMERPSLAGIEGLPSAIADGFLTISARHPDLTRRELIREAQKRFLRLSSFLSLESLASEEVDDHVENVFLQVVASLHGPQPTSAVPV
jgi:hypothetical protein